jgi:hypothetical protein
MPDNHLLDFKNVRKSQDRKMTIEENGVQLNRKNRLQGVQLAPLSHAGISDKMTDSFK